MAQCERLAACPFSNDHLAEMPVVGGLLKAMYCLGEKTECARYEVAQAGLQVPLDLFPDDHPRARRLLRKP